MVQVDLAFEVLPRVGEGQAVQLALRAGSGQLDRRVHADHAAAEARHDVGERRILVHSGLVRREVDCVVIPPLDRDDRQRRAVPHDDLDVLGLRGRALVAEDHGAPRVRLRLDHDVRVRHPTGAGETDDDRLIELDVRRDADERRLRLLRPRDRAGHVFGAEHLAARGLVHLQAEMLHLRGSAHLDRDDVVGRRLVDQQRSEPVEWGVLPVDLAAGGRAEVRRVVRPRSLRPRLHGHEAAVGQDGRRVDVTLRGVRGGLSRCRHQPTDPSMPISMSLFSSRAYSMGSSRAIGSMKPRTIIAMASSSGIPRLMR